MDAGTGGWGVVRIGALAGPVALGAVVLLGLGSSTPLDTVGPLVPVPTDGAGISVRNTQHSRTWSVVGLLSCSRSSPASFVVRSVTLLEVTGDVAVVPGVSAATSPFVGLGVQPGPLLPSYVAPGPLDARSFRSPGCSGGLAAGAAVTSDGPWSARGMELVYVANGTEHTVRWRFDLDVCAPGGHGPCPSHGDAPGDAPGAGLAPTAG